MVGIRKCSFPLRQKWSTIHERLMSLKMYKGISEISLAGEHSWSEEEKEKAARKLFQLAFEENSGEYYAGKSVVYMKQDIYEKISLHFSTKSIICIQQRIRGVLTRMIVKRQRDAIIKVQRLWWARKYRLLKCAAVVKCQSFVRMCQARNTVHIRKRIRDAAYLLNRWKTRVRIRKRGYATLIRLFLLRPSWRLPISRMPHAHRTLSYWFRSMLCRLYFLKLKKIVTRISAWWRSRCAVFVFRVEIKQLRVILRNRLERQSIKRISK